MKIELADKLNLFGPAMTEKPSLLSARVSTEAMKTKINKSLVICLLLAVAGGYAVSATAADAPNTKPGTTSTKPTTQQLTGKVVAVDKITKTVSIQIGTQTYTLQLTDKTKIAQGGSDKKMDAITVGEEISVTVTVRELAGGKVEVVVTSVDLPTDTAAQGPKGKGGGYGFGFGGTPPPFPGGPNPGNLDGPVVSKHK